MPSTYTVNLGIEKPATGEQSGTWGDTANINFDILDQAINGCLSLTLASAGTSGSPNTLAISDGAASDGRNKWIEFVDGGDLGATAYVQLTPNDAEKIVFIRNSLSGSRSVILFQGTYDAGRDLEVPAGVDMVVKFSGGGATATTTDVFTKLRATEITTPTLTAGTADINGGTVDGATIGGATPAAGTFTNLTANTNLTINATTTVDGVIDDDTMGTASATKLSTSESIKAYVDTQVGANNELSEVLANGNTTGANNIIVDSGQAITTNTINETTAGSGVTIDSVLLKDDGVNATNLEITNIKANDGTAAGSIANSTGAVTITSFISNSVDIGGGAIDDVVIGGSTPAAGSFTTLSASTSITGTLATAAQTNITSVGSLTSLDVAGSVTADGLTVDNAGTIQLTKNTSAYQDSLGIVEFHDEDGNASADAGKFQLQAFRGGDKDAPDFKLIGSDSTGVLRDRIQVEGTGDISFYEDTGTTPKFFWDASAESLGIGTTSPSRGPLHLNVGSDATEIHMTNAGTGTGSGDGFTLFMTEDGNGAGVWLREAEPLRFATSGSEAMRIDSSGNVGIGVSSPDATIHANVGTAGNNIAKFSDPNNRALIVKAVTAGMEIITTEETDETDADRALIFKRGTSETMRIDSSGNVGVGTSSPNAKLDVRGQTLLGANIGSSSSIANFISGTPPQLVAGFSIPAVTWTPSAETEAVFTRAGNMFVDILAENDSNSRLNFSDTDDEDVGWIDYDHADNNMNFRTNGSEAMRIDSSGYVGIGTSSPSFELDVVGASDTSIRVRATGAGSGDDAILRVSVANANASNYIQFGDNSDSDAGYIRYQHSNDSLQIGVNASEAMRIDSSGNVGIGTNSPNQILEVRGQAAKIRIADSDVSGTTGIEFVDSGSVVDAEIEVGNSTQYLAIKTAGSEAMRIDSSGNLLVGTTSAAGVLTINGDQTYFTTSSATNASLTLRKGAAGADGVDFLQCRDSANNAEFVIQGDGDAQNTNNSYGAISDAKLKENVTDATPKLDKLNQVRVVNYNLIGHERKQIGVIAQELEQIFPSMVQDTIDRDAEGNDLGTTTKSVKYSVFVPMLIKAMQEQDTALQEALTKIDALETRITALEG